MLRITQNRELKFRKSESGLSRDSLKGFGLALAIHLLLLAFFRIVSLPNLDTIKPLMPIAVEIDLHTNEIHVLPDTKAIPVLKSFTSSPNFADLYDMPILQLKKEPFSLKKIAIDEPDFSTLEKIGYTPLPILGSL
jgi:hypothetical protein